MNINIELPDEVHKRIKILSAMEGIPLKDVIIRALEKSVDEKR
ncbi:MAG: hypothetical protein V1866_02250 [archaeon]